MRAPRQAELLECWETLDGRSPLDRAVGLVALVEAAPAEDIEQWPVGARDAATLDLRARLFGEEMRAVAPCPDCGTAAEFLFTRGDVAAPAAAERSELAIDGRVLALRPVTTRDLRQALASAAPRAAVALACSDADDDLDEAAVTRIADALRRLDPQADLNFDLACEGCGARWTAPFDVQGFVWTELRAWARRRLHDVHVLAGAYGWSESEILALGPARREAYLAMVAG